MWHDMRRFCALLALFTVNAASVLPAQKAVDPTQRYFRLICLVHLTGSGKGGDPIVPEYVMEGVAVAQAAQAAAAAAQAGVSANLCKRLAG